jgi:alpha-tubulin suppressor-like RCC1 family protein
MTSFCVKTDGTMFAWGYNQHGALGLNTAHQEPGSRSSPTQLPGTSWSTGIDKNAGGEYFCISTKTDGTLWSWGDNSDGQLGTSSPTNTDQSSPCQIGTDNTWTKVGAGRQTGYGIKTDGTLWAWGTNSHGVFGNNSPTAQLSSPIQIDGTTWSSVDSGYRHTGSIKTDGTLWMWGEGTNGALAQNNQTHYSSPRQVPGTTWSQVQCGREYSLAVKTDGTAWAWGQNQLGGNLGLNNTTAYSSPVQIPGTSWGLISAAYAGTFGFQKAG